MKRATHISWENFNSTVLVKGEQRVHKVSESPWVELFWDGLDKRVGLCLETSTGTVIPPELARLSFISLRVLSGDRRTLLEISTASNSLRRQFFHYAVAVSERMVSRSSSAIEAVASELQCFADLLAERPILENERQIGLLGELLFLERLVMARGITLLDSWVGPQAEPHDFRVGNREFEVKTTATPHRVHTIHGSEQLIPSKGCSLFLLSVLLGPPGSGSSFSLAGKVQALEQLFASNGPRARQFLSALEQAGMRKVDLPHYERKFAFRRPLAMVPINAKFPALTRPAIQVSLGPLAQRIESLEYSVNLEGLEKEEGTPDFSAVIPSLP